MTIAVTAAIIVILVMAVVIAWLMKSRNDSTSGVTESLNHIRTELLSAGNAQRQEIQAKIDRITAELSQHQRATAESLQKQHSQSLGIIREVTTKITEIENTNKQVLGFAESMRNLENILRNPKQRGIVGEIFLENLLSGILPPANFKMQYVFASGKKVDAAIFTSDKIIPIDAKFSLERYNRIMEATDPEKRRVLEREFKNDLKTRIDETSQYILPGENTTNFALMFIPADGIFYNLLAPKTGTLEINAVDFITYANKKGVNIVSPMTFYAFLQTILNTLNAMKIEMTAVELKRRVEVLGRHLNSYQVFMEKLGNSLGTAVGHFNQSGREFRKIDKDIFQITDGKSGGEFEPAALEKPYREEIVE